MRHLRILLVEVFVRKHLNSSTSIFNFQNSNTQMSLTKQELQMLMRVHLSTVKEDEASKSNYVINDMRMRRQKAMSKISALAQDKSYLRKITFF